MKKLKAIIPDGGAPLGQFPVLREIFDTESKNAIEAMLSSVIIGQTQGVILSGCLATGTAGNFAISAGYIFVDGEVLEYLGSTGNSTTVYLKKSTVTEDSGVFADGATKAYIDVNQATAYTTTGGGSGTQYITLVFAVAGQTLADRMGDFINDGTITLAKMTANNVDSDQYVDGSIDLIHMSANSVDSDQYVDGSIDPEHLSTGVNALFDAKANKIQEAWIPIVRNANFAVNGGRTPQYRKDDFGRVWLRGSFRASSGSPILTSTALPIDYRIKGTDFAGTGTDILIFKNRNPDEPTERLTTIHNDGTIEVDGTSNNDYALDGISWDTEIF